MNAKISEKRPIYASVRVNTVIAVPYVHTTPIPVPVYQCPSGNALLGERWQIAIGGYECTGTQCKECHDR